MRISEALPSWVPDWAIRTPSIIDFHNASNNSFNACKDRLYQREISSRDPEALIVRGKIVSKILCIVNHHFDQHYFMDEDRGFLNLDGHLEYITTLLAPEATDKITRERVLKTLIADGAVPRHRITTEKPSSLSSERIRELLYAYDMWPRMVANDNSIPNLGKVKKDLFQLQQYSLIVQNKRLAGCLGKFLALVPRVCIEKADCQIAILHGSKVPIVMIENPEGKGQWRVIGQCYLEGMMYGEGVDWEEEDADVFTIV